MSRVFFARNKQYYKAKLDREGNMLNMLTEVKNSMQCDATNKQRLYNLLQRSNDWQNGRMMGGTGYNGSLFNLNGLNNNFYNNMLNGMMGTFGGNGYCGTGSIFDGFGGFGSGLMGGLGNIGSNLFNGFGNIGSGILGGLGGLGSGLLGGLGNIGSGLFGGLANIFGLGNMFNNNPYNAMAMDNPYWNQFDDQQLQAMKEADIDAQIQHLNSMIKVDEQELDAAEKAESKAIKEEAAKYTGGGG